MDFQRGMSLSDAAERIAPIVELPADQIAGFVIVVIPATDDVGWSVAASENMPPETAGLLLGTVAGALVTAAATHRAHHGHAGGMN